MDLYSNRATWRLRVPEFISQANRDGYVRENGDVNTDETTFWVKFYPGYTRRGFVSFDTSAIPDDQSIQSVILKIYIDHWQVGKNRGGLLRVNKVSYGYLDSSDYERTPDNVNIATINPGTVDGVWVQSSSFLQINKQGLSQYRVQYDAGNDLSFYAGSGDGNYKPVLIVIYGVPPPPPEVKRIVFCAWLNSTVGNNLVSMRCNVGHNYNFVSGGLPNNPWRQAALDVAVSKNLEIFGGCTAKAATSLGLLNQQELDVIDWVKDKPGFWAWQLFEEPGNTIPGKYSGTQVQAFVAARYAQVKAVDPLHPLCITLGLNPAVFWPFYDMDVSMPACYPCSPGQSHDSIREELEWYYGHESARGQWVLECQNRGIKIMPVLQASTVAAHGHPPCEEWIGLIELQYDWWKQEYNCDGYNFYFYAEIMGCQNIFDGIVNTFETTTQYKPVQGALSFSGNLLAKIKMPLSGILAPASSLVGVHQGEPDIRKSLSGKLNLSGDLNYKIKYLLSGDLSLTGSGVGTLRYELTLLFKKLMHLLQIEDDKTK